MKPVSLRWQKDVAPHDYAAAYSYLSMLLDEDRAARTVNELKKTTVRWRRANDILRGFSREPLGMTDPGVRKNMDKFFNGKKLSPVLLVSFPVGGDIADGYHRVSWAYQVSPYTMVPFRMVSVRPE